MELLDNQRGITPLVATVLLVAFSVGLGALVMSWGEDYIAQKAEFVQGAGEVKSNCDTARLNVIKIGGQSQACISQRGIEVWLDNGEIDLSNIHARVAGMQGLDVKTDILMAPLVKLNSVRAVVAYKPEIGQVLQLKLTPKVWTGTREMLCAEKAIELENIKQCS